MITLILKKDKTTPGTFRFKDIATEDHPLAIYLSKEQCKEENIGDMIKVTIEPTA